MSLHLPRLLSVTAVGGLLLVAACEAPIDVDASGEATAHQAVVASARRDAPSPPPGRCRPPLTAEAAALAPAPRGHRGPPPPAGAHHRGPPPGHPHHGPGDRLLAVYDDDDDGVLDDAERANRDADLAAACVARNAEAIATFDADGDALLNVEEWAAARDAHHAEHRAEHEARVDDADDVTVATWDVDGDGVLSATERPALQKTLRTMVREGLRLPRWLPRPTTMASNEETP